MHLLVTRPQVEGEATAATLRALGHRVTQAPLLQVEALDADLGQRTWDAVLMTSANAARAMAAHPRLGDLTGRPLFAVGRRTAAAARALGFTDIKSADGDAADLETLVATEMPQQSSLLYLAAEARARNVAATLAAAGFSVETVAVYRAVPSDILPDAAARALAAGEIDAVLHFSRRSAEAFLAAVRTAGLEAIVLKCRHFCLAPPIAEALVAAGAARVAAAEHPNEEALLALVGRGSD